MPARPLRSAMAVAVAVGAFALGGCRVDVEVGVDADATGGGEIAVTARLDEAAVAGLGGATPERRLALDDLAAAGWEVEGPKDLDGGGLEVTARHDFADGAEARRLVQDVTGVGGALDRVDLRQERSFLRTTTSFRGEVALRRGLATFTDRDLREALAGSAGAPLGVSDAQLASRFGAPVEEMFELDVSVRLPGEPARAWTSRLGERRVLRADTERWNVENIVAAATTGAAAVGLAAVGAARWAGRRRRRGARVDG